jgi:hypothetical protein
MGESHNKGVYLGGCNESSSQANVGCYFFQIFRLGFNIDSYGVEVEKESGNLMESVRQLAPTRARTSPESGARSRATRRVSPHPPPVPGFFLHTLAACIA